MAYRGDCYSSANRVVPIFIFHLNLTVDYVLIQPNVECNSMDQHLGNFQSLDDCANACRINDQCSFFVYGTNSKEGRCYWEKTTSASCPQGWQNDNFDFYALERGKLHYLKNNSG